LFDICLIFAKWLILECVYVTSVTMYVEFGVFNNLLDLKIVPLVIFGLNGVKESIGCLIASILQSLVLMILILNLSSNEFTLFTMFFLISLEITNIHLSIAMVRAILQ